MSWLTIFRLLFVWYLTVQVVSLAVLPLTLRVLRALPDRGYSLAKISGILTVGVVYWLGFSYGVLRNERGGVWIALVLVAAVSWTMAWRDVVAWWRDVRQNGHLRTVMTGEALFLLAFVGWAIVRAYDPNVDHTEQPMDLMFMNSIWASPTYPPQDAWLAGYGISYYYLGYWLLNTVARLANTPPNVAYNLGQAVWYGLLWVGCYAVVMNLLAWKMGQPGEDIPRQMQAARPSWLSVMGGVLASVTVAFGGNLLVILEWFYAQGMGLEGLIKWIGVHNFPERASQTGEWYISFDWWWWRSSRVIQDIDLLGNRIEVSPIDEFPMFSYLLGDNHPHVTAMPIVLLVIALSLNLMFLFVRSQSSDADRSERKWASWLPLDGVDMAYFLMAIGSLVFLNTWDFPPYWILLVTIVLLGGRQSWRGAILTGIAVLVGTAILYLPYFLTAQSQAGGIIPNVFNPTRLPQFLIMFGGLLPAVIGVAILGMRLARPRWTTIGAVALVTIGAPVALLLFSAAMSSTNWGQKQLANLPLPAGVDSYAEVIIQRWLQEPWTFLTVGLLLTLLVGCLVSLYFRPLDAWFAHADLVFVMLLGAIGLAMVYAPEFVFLRDYFGSRMNTVFKFYYQGWLLMGLSAAYLISVASRRITQENGLLQGLALTSLILILGGTLFPIAGIYAKTGGFSRETPTLDATAYVAERLPDVMAAVEWVQANTTPGELVLEAKGGSYSAHHNRISTMTGRPTLLGWDGHESQWRGEAYGEMAQGRPAAIEQVYPTGPPYEIPPLLEQWGIDYVFVGPSEIELYGITSIRLEELNAAMENVFSRGQVTIFRRR